MTTETVAGVYEARMTRLMREAGPRNSATVVAVTEMARTLDEFASRLEVLLAERQARRTEVTL